MTIETTPLREEFTGNGVSTSMPYTWRVRSKEHLLLTRVTVADESEQVPLEVDVDYLVNDVNDPDGGTITFIDGVGDPTAPAATYRYVLTSAAPDEQPIDFTAENNVPPERIEDAMDYIVILIKQAREILDRAVTLPVGSQEDPEDYITEIREALADAIAARDAAEGHRDAADADAVQTAADAVQTAADRVQTGLDRVATGADAAQTAADAVDTAADRLQVAIDKAATAASAAAALTSETNAAASAAKLKGTSASSVAIGSGSKSFTTQAAKDFDVGTFLLLYSAADPTNYMHGQVTAYNSGTGALTVSVGATGGSGTFADWVIHVSGARGAAGTNGTITSPGSSTDNAIMRWNGAAGTDAQDSVVTVGDTGAVAGVTNLSFSGQTLGPGGAVSAPDYSFTGDTTTGIRRAAASDMRFTIAGADIFRILAASIIIETATSLGWSSTGIGTPDTVIKRDAAGVIAQRSGATAQGHLIYNTYTNSSNYERGAIDWNTTANVFTIGTQKAGTGVNRAMQFTIGGTNIVQLSASGHLLWNTDNTYTLGALNATRPSNIYAAAGVAAGNLSTAMQGVSAPFKSSATNTLVFAGESTIASSPTTGGAFAALYSNDGAAMANGDRLGGFLIGGATSASAVVNSALIAAFATEAFTGTESGTRLDFETTANGGNVRNAKMRLMGDGKLAVAETIFNPTALVDIEGSSTGRASLRIRSGVAPTAPNDGDFYQDGTNLYARINGAWRQLNQQAGGTVYTSGNQTITSAGLLTLAHGLGVTPTVFREYLVNVATEGNWNGETIPINTGAGQSQPLSRGTVIYADSTNVYVRFGSDGSAMNCLNKTSGVSFAITNAKWNYKISVAA